MRTGRPRLAVVPGIGPASVSLPPTIQVDLTRLIADLPITHD